VEEDVLFGVGGHTVRCLGGLMECFNKERLLQGESINTDATSHGVPESVTFIDLNSSRDDLQHPTVGVGGCGSMVGRRQKPETNGVDGQ